MPLFLIIVLVSYFVTSGTVGVKLISVFGNLSFIILAILLFIGVVFSFIFIGSLIFGVTSTNTKTGEVTHFKKGFSSIKTAIKEKTVPVIVIGLISLYFNYFMLDLIKSSIDPVIDNFSSVSAESWKLMVFLLVVNIISRYIISIIKRNQKNAIINKN